MRIISLLCLGLLTLAPPQSRAQAPAPPALHRDVKIDHYHGSQKKTEEAVADDVIRVNTTVVNVPVSVMERDGKYVPNLQKQDFRLYQDGVEQQLAYFEPLEKPFTVALLLDLSDSTDRRLPEIQQAAISFVEQLRPDDQVLIVSFDSKINILSEATSDRRALRQAILTTRSGQGTRLYDAIDFVVNHRLNSVTGRKAIVLFTDGVDLNSKTEEVRTIRDLEEADVLVYPVRFETEGDVRQKLGETNGPVFGAATNIAKGSRHEDFVRGRNYLETLATRTGGRIYSSSGQKSTAKAFALVAEALRWQYSLGYYPRPLGEAGQRHKLKVRVNRTNVAVRARESYIRSKGEPKEK